MEEKNLDFMYLCGLYIVNRLVIFKEFFLFLFFKEKNCKLVLGI